MTEIEKIFDWIFILSALVGAIFSFVVPYPIVAFQVMFPALFVMGLATFIKRKAVKLSIMIVCTLVVLFVVIKQFLTI